SLWHADGCCGDANWTDADQGGPVFALAARTAQSNEVFTVDGSSPLSFNNILTTDPVAMPLFLQFIQTPVSEPPLPLLDAVMLAHLPLKDGGGSPVPGPLGQPNPSGRPVLIRTSAFGTNPHADTSLFQNWYLESSDVPAGAIAFWVGGGHATPVFYAMAKEAGTLVLYQRLGRGTG